jgi:PST family polysaccharide transporter
MKPFDAEGNFRPVEAGDGLRRAAVRGAGITVVLQAVAFLVQMASTLLLARLLTPMDFGLITMVTTFSLLLASVGVNGLFEAVIQRPTLDHRLSSNLFWITASLSAVLTVGFAASGSLIARFYGNALLRQVSVAMSATIFLTSISGIHIALLKRAMRFGALSTNDVVARAASVIVSIVLAWLGWGYWALVAGAIVLPLSTSIGVFVLCRWLPGLPRRCQGTVGMIRFALNTFGHFAANYGTRNLDNLLVGAFLGPQTLGLYKKAYDLCVLPVGQLSIPLNAVAIPTLSRLAGDPPRYRRYVLRALAPVAFLGMGIGACLTIVGKDLILLLLGQRWEESGRIFTVFAPGIGALLIYLTYIWIHLSIGRPDRLFRWGLFELSVFGLLFFVGLKWGAKGVAAAWLTGSSILSIPAIWYAGQPVGLEIGSVARAIWRYVLASALAGVATALIVRGGTAGQLLALGLLGRIVIASLLFGVLYLVAVVIVHGGFAPLYEAARILHDLVPERFSRLVRSTVVTEVGSAS